MAPTAPKKRPSIRSKSSTNTNSTGKPKSGSGLIARTSSPSNNTSTFSPTFTSSKKDKRTIKHSAFISRIEKAHKKPLRRRRPNKKLVTTLEGLVDALPDVADLVNGKGGGRGKGAKSLRSKPGAMKRKERLERGERERFGRNLAIIMGSRGEAEMGDAAPAHEGANSALAPPSATASRFAALRAWVGTNMEKHPAFEKGKE